MSLIRKRTWLQGIVDFTRQNPNQVPKDIFFQFSKNQPYGIKSSMNFRIEKIESKPIVIKAKKHQRLEKAGKKNMTSWNYQTFDNTSHRKNRKTTVNVIMKKKAKILGELGKLFSQHKKKSSRQLLIDEVVETQKSYKELSDRITLLTLHKYRTKSL